MHALCLLAGLCALAVSAGAPAVGQSVGIVATVNDEPISAWDVSQRMKFYQSTGANGGAEALRKRALDELVNEALMTQEASRVGVAVDDDNVRSSIERRLQPLNRTYGQFEQFLSGRGVDIATLENQIRAQLAWASVVRRTFGNLISITESDIEEAASSLDSEEAGSEDDVLVLQHVLFKVPPGSTDTVYASRMTEAERIRDLFVDCARNKQTLARFSEVAVSDMPDTKATDLDEPMRSLVRQASAGEVTPPNLTNEGIEMYAVCERGAAGGRLQVAERQLMTQELSLLSERHLRDLRQDAVVDYR